MVAVAATLDGCGVRQRTAAVDMTEAAEAEDRGATPEPWLGLGVNARRDGGGFAIQSAPSADTGKGRGTADDKQRTPSAPSSPLSAIKINKIK
jgi:hypothetical protein